jgi:hypothetical protein
VRACWPGTLAPQLSSTRRGFFYVEARHTGVGVLSASDAAAAALLAKLRLWGFPASRLPLEDGGAVPAVGKTIAFLPGSRVAAMALAGDLRVPAGSVTRSGDMQRKLVVTTGR